MVYTYELYVGTSKALNRHSQDKKILFLQYIIINGDSIWHWTDSFSRLCQTRHVSLGTY